MCEVSPLHPVYDKPQEKKLFSYLAFILAPPKNAIFFISLKVTDNMSATPQYLLLFFQSFLLRKSVICIRLFR